MQEVGLQKLEKIDLLEKRVIQVIEKMTELQSRCEALQNQNKELDAQLIDLRKHNNEMSEQVAELESAKAGSGQLGIEDQKILEKIDGMLEKFGELQI